MKHCYLVICYGQRGFDHFFLMVFCRNIFYADKQIEKQTFLGQLQYSGINLNCDIKVNSMEPIVFFGEL